LLGTFTLIRKQLFKEKWVIRKYDRINRFGLRKYMIKDSFWNIVSSVILIISSFYMYFPIFWRTAAVVGGVMSLLMGLSALVTSFKKAKVPNSIELTNEIKTDQINKLHRQTLTTLVLRLIGLFSWTKTFPVHQLKISSTMEKTISFVLIIALIVEISINVIFDRRKKKTEKCA